MPRWLAGLLPRLLAGLLGAEGDLPRLFVLMVVAVVVMLAVLDGLPTRFRGGGEPMLFTGTPRAPGA